LVQDVVRELQGGGVGAGVAVEMGEVCEGEEAEVERHEAEIRVWL
jgi:hypothetical protein